MIPCKDCITFAVCNAQITDDSPFEDVLHILVPKCSIIREYTGWYKQYFSTRVIIKVAKFFKPKSSYINYSENEIVNSPSYRL